MQLYKDNLGKVSVTVEQGYWDINKDYDKLTVVEKEGIFGTYISRKPVPAGTVLTDREYWIPFSSLKEQIVIDYNSFIDKYERTLENHEDRIVELEKINDLVEQAITNTETVIDGVSTLTEQARLAIARANETLDRAELLIESFETSKNELYEIAQSSKDEVDEVIELKGKPNGYATLDSSGRVPAAQLPSYVDDVVEYPSLNDFPAKGEKGKIYVSVDTNKQYRWSGSTYIEMPNIDEIQEVKDLVIGIHTTVNVSASPSLIEKGVGTPITINSSVKFNNTQNLSHTKVIRVNGSTVSNPYSVSDATTFNVEINVNNADPKLVMTTNKTVSVNAVYPRYYGRANKETLVSSDVLAFTKQPISTSPNGTYNINSTAADYLWLCVPSNMTIHKVTSNGFDVAMNGSINVGVSDKGTYKCYRSTLKINPGTITIVIQ